MDNLSRQLQSLLVSMGYMPDSVPHEVAHGIEHLLHLLKMEDEEALTRYYGLFGEQRLSLDEIARQRGLCPEDMMASIDASIRRIAVTPEWEMIKGNINH